MTERTISTIVENDPNEPDKLISAPFKNDIGEQNCFVNVIIHALHYTFPIQNFFETEDISDHENFNLLVELSTVLEKYRQLTSKIYFNKIAKGVRYCNVVNIRGELDYMYEDKNLLKIGSMGEPSDVFYIFLNGIHCYCQQEGSLLNEQKEECKDKNCPSHNSYYINLVSQLECINCDNKSDILKFPPNNYMYDIDVNFIISKLENMQYFDEFYCKLFDFEKEKYSNDITELDGNVNCECKEQKIQKNIILIKANKYLCFTLSWNTFNPKVSDICKVFYTIPQIFSNEEIFTVYDPYSVETYFLFGLICYADNHNICFFLNVDAKDEVEVYWILNNDMVTLKMDSFKDVLKYCIKNHYFPKMLFYQIKDKENSKFNDIINEKFSDEDYFQMYNFSLKIDMENAISYSNENNLESRLRPEDTQTHKTFDEHLIKSINDMRKNDEKRKKPQTVKLDSEGNPTLVNDDDDLLTYETLSDLPPPRKIMEEDKSKYLINDDDLLNDNNIRTTPLLLKNEWFCTQCQNVNNISSFECSKCKNIDMNIFDLIENENSKTNKDTFYVGNRRKNKGETRKKTYYTSNNDNQYDKKCLNCGNVYYNKCNFCKNEKTFSQIRDENQMKLVNFVYNRPSKVSKRKNEIKKNEIKINKNNERRWKCNNCNNINEKIDYCKFCKKNRNFI